MEYYTILTDAGRALEAAALAGERTYTLATCALGSVAGTPNPAQTGLRGEVWRGSINTITADAENPNWLIIEARVPPEDGGFTIREFGIYTDDGTLFAVGNYPETYKPTFSQGTGIDLVVRIICQVENAEIVNLLTDPSVALASKKYVDELFKKVPRRNVGEVFYYQGNSAPYGSVIADGALLSREIYPALWTFARENGRVISEAQWQAKAGTESSVGFFSDGDGSTTFRVPKLSDYLRATDSSTSVGQWQGDAIRNITGQHHGMFSDDATSGVFKNLAIIGPVHPTSGILSTWKEGVLGFDASRVVPTAEENRPKTIRLLACIHAFDAIIPKAQADMAEYLNALNRKEDRITRLTANTTFYVRLDGLDENDALTPETAVRSFQKIYQILRALDCGGFSVTVDIGPGTWPAFHIPNAINIRHLFIRGAGSALTTIEAPGGYGVLNNIATCLGLVSQMTITNCACCLRVDLHSMLDIGDDINFGTATISHIHATNNSVISHIGTKWKISGSAQYHASSGTASCINMDGVEVTLEGTPHFSIAFVHAAYNGCIVASSASFQGNATGVRYAVTLNGVIGGGGKGANYFPGSIAGISNNGGTYV